MTGFLSFLSRIIPWGRSLVETSPWASGGGGRKAPPTAPPIAPASDLPNEDWLLSGTWLEVGSSNVHELRYLWDNKTLEVVFKGADRQGRAYAYGYFNVPPKVASDFTQTSSPGRFVWNSLRDRYSYVRYTSIPAYAPRTPTVIRAPGDEELLRKGINPDRLPWAQRAPWQVKPWGG